MDWSARVREAERAVQIDRRSDDWTIRRHDGEGELCLSTFELRHLVRRVKAALDAEDTAHMKALRIVEEHPADEGAGG